MLQIVPQFRRGLASAAAALKQKAKPLHNKKRSEEKVKASSKSVYITCARRELNLEIPGNTQSKFGTIPLASHGWMHYKSKGDHFTINPIVTASELQGEMVPIANFISQSRLKFDKRLLENLQRELGITSLTKIQTKAALPVYRGNHTLIAAETGCGKTLAYLLPIAQKVLEVRPAEADRKLNSPLALIITPGRELASQISQVAEKLCEGTDIKIATLLGGNTKKLINNPNFEDVDILVASLGAVSKLITTGIYRMKHVRHVVLDEADTLLDDSFFMKLGHLLKKFPFYNSSMLDNTDTITQLVLAAATMPTNTEECLIHVIDTNTIQHVVSQNLHKVMPHVEQRFQRMSKADRPGNLLAIVKRDLEKSRPLIIFSNKSSTCDYVSLFLNNSGVNCLNLNGDMLMKIRIGRFERFQSGDCDVLSTTDMASRGLDTTRARHIINFDFPMYVSDYIHRCGRIGRIGNLQKALVTSFVSSRHEIKTVQQIEHAARTGSILQNVNANIRKIIDERILREIKKADREMGLLEPESTGLQENELSGFDEEASEHEQPF